MQILLSLEEAMFHFPAQISQQPVTTKCTNGMHTLLEGRTLSLHLELGSGWDREKWVPGGKEAKNN